VLPIAGVGLAALHPPRSRDPLSGSYRMHRALHRCALCERGPCVLQWSCRAPVRLLPLPVSSHARIAANTRARALSGYR
jgi:hypothetical protein